MEQILNSGEDLGQIKHLSFCKVRKLTKSPFEDDWEKNLYTYDQIVPWVNAGNNYGIMSGYHNLVTLDCDCKEYVELAEKFLPATFTVQSSSSEKRHFLFYMTDFISHLNKIVFIDPNDPDDPKKQGGDIRFKDFQTLGPGSIHPDTKKSYTIHDNLPIAELSFLVILSVFGKYFKTSIIPPSTTQNTDNSSQSLPIIDVLNYYKISLTPRQCGCEHYGPHPMHGSTGGTNFSVNTKNDVWHCFRCDSGGGALLLIAVMEKTIDCSEAKPGGLKGAKFNETCRIAEEKFGFKYNIKKLTQGEVLTRLCEEHIKTYFMDQQGEPMVVLPFDNHSETCPAKSTRLRNWLAGLFRERNQHPPNSDALKQAQIQVEVKCSNSCSTVLFNRVGWYEGAIYYDLTSPDWRGVRITKDGWEVVALPPVFRRYKHQVAQVIPTPEGNSNDFLRFCNIREYDYCLFMITAATFFIDGFPHVMPYLDGRQGEGKSFTSKRVKRLVDPSMALVMSTPKNLEHAQMIGEKHWLTVFDNISYIGEWFSDFLCRGITGEGDMKRSLYTDDDEFIRAYRRCFFVNGIGTYAERPDLLDRSIIFKVPKLSMNRSEEEIIAEWNRMLPGILGHFFTAISKAMGVVDQIKGHEKFRMADFARWGAALAGPLGYSQDEFFRKYQESVDSKWEDAADVNTLNGKIVELMRSGDDWEGTFTDLLEVVNPKSDRDKNLPNNPRKLSSELKRIGPLLLTSGIRWAYLKEREPGKGRKRILIGKVDK